MGNNHSTKSKIEKEYKSTKKSGSSSSRCSTSTTHTLTGLSDGVDRSTSFQTTFNRKTARTPSDDIPTCRHKILTHSGQTSFSSACSNFDSSFESNDEEKTKGSLSSGFASGYTTGKTSRTPSGDIPTCRYNSNTRKNTLTENKKNIKKNFRYLKEELDTSEIVDYMFECEQLSQADTEDINCRPERHRRVDLLLRKVLRLSEKGSASFYESLRKHGYEYAWKHLMDDGPQSHCFNYHLSIEVASRRIHIYSKELLEQLEPQNIADFFIVYDVINIDEYEEIIENRTRRRQASALIKEILLHLPESYNVLMFALLSTNGEYLAEKLKSDGFIDKTFSGLRFINFELTGETKSNKGYTEPHLQLLQTGPFIASVEGHPDLKIKVELLKSNERNGIENHVVQFFNRRENQLMANDNILKDIGALITGADVGSIIIHLESCGPETRAKITKMCQTGTILSFLEKMVIQDDIVKHIPYGNFRFELTIKAFTTITPAFQWETVPTRQSLFRKNFDFLEKELEPLIVVNDLVDIGVLEETDRKTIIHPKNTRRERVRQMLRSIDNKGERAIEELVTVLTEKKKMYIVERLTPSTKCDEPEFQNVAVALLPSLYCRLVDEISPGRIADECVAKEILDKDFIQTIFKETQRILQSQALLQSVMMRGKLEKAKFLEVLLKHGYVSQFDIDDTVSKTNGPAGSGKGESLFANEHETFDFVFNFTVDENKCINNSIDRYMHFQRKRQENHFQNIVFTGQFLLMNEIHLDDDIPKVTICSFKTTDQQRRQRTDDIHAFGFKEIKSQASLVTQSGIHRAVNVHLGHNDSVTDIPKVTIYSNTKTDQKRKQRTDGSLVSAMHLKCHNGCIGEQKSTRSMDSGYSGSLST